jgi:NAD(P)-dependent dehydrogenase (short-subunit alcohol dehydrogenase family)
VALAFAREGARVFLAGRTRGKLDSVAERAGHIDVSFNLVSFGDVQGTALAEMSLEDVTRPVMTIVRTQFLTTRAAARHMTKQGSGVILAFGGSGEPVPLLGSLCVAFDAVESLRRQWACELGPHGVRFVTLKTGGVPETIPDTFEGRDAIVSGIEQAALLNRTATLADVGNVAAFVASDHARTMTSATVNISCGAIVDYEQGLVAGLQCRDVANWAPS